MTMAHLSTRHSFRIHCVFFEGVAQLVQSYLEETPDRTLTRSTGADNDYTHPLVQLLIQLKSFVNLFRQREREERNRRNENMKKNGD